MADPKGETALAKHLFSHEAPDLEFVGLGVSCQGLGNNNIALEASSYHGGG